MKPSRGCSASEIHAADGLEQEAPEEENAQDDGKRDDDDLDESHSRFLTLKALAPCSSGHFIGARSGVSTPASSLKDRPRCPFSSRQYAKKAGAVPWSLFILVGRATGS